MIKKVLPLFVSLILSGKLFAEPQISLTLEGVSGAIEDNIEAHLSAIDEKDYSTSLRFQSRLDVIINSALNALGYYHATIDYQISTDQQELIAHITLGDPVTIDTMDVKIDGEASTDKDFIQLIEKSPVKQGAVLNHGDYDALKSSIRNLALQKGYFKGDFTEARLEVAADLNRAFVRLHYASGIRYHFGETTVTGSQIEDNRVRSLQPYQAGDPYLVAKVGEYNQNLSNTDWFSSVFVEPDLTLLDESRVLPMKVSLAPQAKNQIETGIGYATDVEFRGTLKWKKPWVNELGHSFDSSLLISKPEQTITAGYQIPLEDVLHDYYRIQYAMKNVDSRDTKSLESNLAVERHWLLDNRWHRTVFVRYLIENYEQGLQDDVAQFVLPGISFSRSRVRGGSMPSWGDKQSITLEFGDDHLLSETSVLRVQGRTTWIRSLGENHRGIARLEGGANIADEFDKLSPSLRFFAGGDNNLRGYGYESISPKDESGALTGAKYIATSTLEYQYRLVGNWWAAAFVDYGDAFNETPDWKTGAGIGVRWGSPVGPIRLDFAWGLDAEPGDEFRVHFTLGPEL
ncbi:autotransporter assembly complex protein TamA [Vibrio sp. IRLE0018]|uniref:autotransporter assembly complex protein TamA n=1 Tax=Vibrio TaxID=662 RepID=UPI0015932AE4|nr:MULTISPECIES: autotransporter assembly complex family protein [Vibrio]MCF8780376.1 autotransporter assembly complex protein TamA [Vibrio floridensis]NVC63339.1 outer membrane protein assembly factor [Vibrio sp. 05-20-BW147]